MVTASYDGKSATIVEWHALENSSPKTTVRRRGWVNFSQLTVLSHYMKIVYVFHMGFGFSI